MLYLPPESLLQLAAAAANEPEGSGNTYQLMVTGPLPEPPQPASRASAATAPTTVASRLRRKVASRLRLRACRVALPARYAHGHPRSRNDLTSLLTRAPPAFGLEGDPRHTTASPKR